MPCKQAQPPSLRPLVVAPSILGCDGEAAKASGVQVGREVPAAVPHRLERGGALAVAHAGPRVVVRGVEVVVHAVDVKAGVLQLVRRGGVLPRRELRVEYQPLGVHVLEAAVRVKLQAHLLSLRVIRLQGAAD